MKNAFFNAVCAASVSGGMEINMIIQMIAACTALKIALAKTARDEVIKIKKRNSNEKGNL